MISLGICFLLNCAIENIKCVLIWFGILYIVILECLGVVGCVLTVVFRGASMDPIYSNIHISLYVSTHSLELEHEFGTTSMV